MNAHYPHQQTERPKRYVLTLDGRTTFRPYLVDDPRRQRFHIDGETHYLVFKRNGIVGLHIDGVSYPFNMDGNTTVHLKNGQRVHLLQFTPSSTRRNTRACQDQDQSSNKSANQLSYVTNLITQLMQNGLLPPPSFSSPVKNVEVDHFAISTFGLDVIPTLRSTNRVDDYVTQLYGDQQCARCGLRCPHDGAFRTHLTRHMADDQRNEKITNRQWYPSRISWVRPVH